MDHTPSRIFTLGPEGTFSDQAAQRLRARQGGEALPIEYTRTIPEVLARTEAEGRALGVVPIENSVAGTVTQAQDYIVQHRLSIIWEINIHVRFSLLSRAPLDTVQVYYSHPQAFDQCSEYLAASLPQGRVEFSNSNTESGQRLLEQPEGAQAAAIVPLDFGEEHPALLVAKDIQNYQNNTTRFVVVRRTTADESYDFSRNKTSLLVEPNEDRPGLLHELLSVFHRHELNLCRLESRPAKVTPWTYVFYLDFNNNPQSAACIKDLQGLPHRIHLLGSYDLLD
ncbi:MAG: prephenate dehydratase [SAR324 cluster bacterium]|nr:prephenate dehydratase [SAR324 cluster bacterium]MCZ6532810.1 prephenate dehydratase [SAR324 cluster bacterium]MCZ6628592.1 prephenate dehydratase [SAR324 cluster bacterium]MCZ6644962.1 prephenate dehydratase [SAR324 cluster bacterium]MCZ6729384.1 prephenate dehydratase [SAR324 cluster bacterium]